CALAGKAMSAIATIAPRNPTVIGLMSPPCRSVPRAFTARNGVAWMSQGLDRRRPLPHGDLAFERRGRKCHPRNTPDRRRSSRKKTKKSAVPRQAPRRSYPEVDTSGRQERPTVVSRADRAYARWHIRCAGASPRGQFQRVKDDGEVRKSAALVSRLRAR